MGFIRLTVSVILAMTLLSPGLSASGFENTGLGIKARGMGGAFRSIANDWTAAYYNPAGYAFVYDNQLGASVGIMHQRDELTPSYYSGDIYESGFYNGYTINNNHEVYTLPAAGFIVRFPVFGETVFGLSAYQPFDYSISWKLYEPPLAYNGSTSGYLPATQYGQNIDVIAFQLTAAREFKEDELSLGIGLQLLRADLVYKNLYLRDNPLDSDVYPDILSDRPFDKIPEFTKNDGNGWGFGLNFGMFWKYNEKLNIALTAALPFEITIKGTTAFLYVMPENTYLIQQGDTTGYQPGTVGYLFSNGEPVSYQSDFETKLQLPPSIGLGLSYKLNEKLTLALDAQLTFWSQFEGYEFMYSNFGNIPLSEIEAMNEFFTTNLTNPVDWNNAGKIMLGCMYDYKPSVTFLGGVSADQSASRDATGFSPQLLDTGDKYGLNLGVLLHIERWEFGLVTSYYYYPDDLMVYDAEDLDNDGIADQFPGEYKASTFETILAFNYWF
ncbi:MAG: OmpP1/FadL family transporter [Candidatus Zixiibacteriota bacterium]